MPVLETDFLKGLIDPSDQLHEASLKALERVKRGEWHVASSALLELDLVLKGLGISMEERVMTHYALMAEIPQSMILSLTPRILLRAVQLQMRYRDISRFYLDSIHLATALELDGEIVSSDKTFDEVEEVRRLPLEELGDGA
ncbi:MAG TPA: type II toxin-antitoxin system VapC family toxin [Candidatus Bathyarchaeota archaeon]|nr:type II toxin-antitoxin system VapC family toxin [Candidatus Bathyarchaeota archaeon]